MYLDGKVSGKKLSLEGGNLKLPADGENKNIYVRAEDVQIDAEGSLTGHVETVTFLGMHYRLGIKGIMPGILTSIYAGHTAPKVGDTVRIAIQPNALMLLPKELPGA